ncbi:MAG: DUF4139 domain-containing protein [Bacteroidales bacterium]|jgi:uncharacterized protein (TIGR02231 family)|nr:DUF4139 domain-containing protein [Bacteroidales bacterium]MDD4213850.1 DUF4139 domain-containing protein [Bacteroidales bacterium]
MKKLIIFLLVICNAMLFKANSQPKTIKSKIKEVTVFFNGAQITQAGDINLQEGQSTILFEGLTQYINAQSIQVKGEGKFDILSVTHHINYLKNQEKLPEVSRIEDSLEILGKQLTQQQTILNVYVQEESMLLANKVIGGESTGVKVSELMQATEYFRTRLLDIKNNQMKIQEKISAIQKRITANNNQLAVYNSKTTEPTSEILVTVVSETALSAKLILSYYVTNAGWTPTYDMRATNINNPIELDFRANVHQTTGTDWNKVKLTLSTGNPMQNGVKPVLNPWYLSYIYPYRYSYPAQAKSETTTLEKKAADGDEEAFTPVAGSAADYTVVNETQTNIEYIISLPYDISSDGKNYMVEIQKNTLPALYEYYCAPKLSKDVFLVARVSGWDKYNIISGEMNLFFEGTYVGKSYIDTRVTSDTLEFSLGIDKNISVNREKIKDFSSTKILGLNKKETFAFNISVRNKKKQSIDILIEDQLPITSDKDIEVEAIEISGATKDEDKGILRWRFNIKPAETKELKLSYSVKYPKDKILNIN